MSVKQENAWRKTFCDRVMATWPHTEIIKTHIGAFDSAGIPDLYIASRGLGSVWLELKWTNSVFDWRAQPTLLQKDRARRLYYAGANVGVLVFFGAVWRSVHGSRLMEAFHVPGTVDKDWSCWTTNLDERALVFGP